MAGETFVLTTDREPTIEIVLAAEPSMSELEEFLEALGAYLERRPPGPLYALVDMSLTKASTAERRSRYGDFFKTHGDYLEANCRGVAFVAKSVVARGAMTAVFWLKPTEWPTKVFSSREPAEAWLERQVQAT